MLQPVRDHFGVTVINSGYRGPALNEAVGGSSKSQHCKGEAADIECPGVPNYDVAKWIEDNLDFDQLILEFYTKRQTLDLDIMKQIEDILHCNREGYSHRSRRKLYRRTQDSIRELLHRYA